MTEAVTRRLSLVPIPALITGIAVIYFTVEPSLYLEPSWILPITNTIFVTLICLSVAWIAMRNYSTTGRLQILLLGCGLLSFGIGAAIAAWLRRVPVAGANLNVTVYNTAALMGAAFHFAAALILLTGISPQAGAKRKGFWLAFSYTGVAVSITVFSIAAVEHLVPPFFVQGVGPTPLRQGILGAAVILFCFSFLILMGWYIRNREEFLYWYSSALALTCISLAAFFIQRSVGSPIGWVGRIAQYFGGIYFLAAILRAIRSAHVRRVPFDNIITASLSPSEEKFRALAENSPDIIDCFDRELRHIYVNPAGLRAQDKTAAAVIGKTIDESGVPEPYWKARIEQVFATGQPIEVEDYIQTRRGREFFVSHCVPEYGPDGTVANVLVLSRDLTARKRAQENLNRRNRTLDGINTIFQEALHCTTDEELGRACLRVAEDITESAFGFIAEIGSDGLLHDIAISDPGWQVCTIGGHQNRRPPASFKIHGLYGRVLKDGKSLLSNSPSQHRASIGTPAGHPPLTAFLGVPLLDGGRTAGMIALGNRPGGYRQEDVEVVEGLAPTVLEVLQRKRTEQALIRSEKLVSVGRLAATMAHEINNPLAGATNAVYLVSQDESVSPAARSMAEMADRELRRAAEIVRRVLGFYREPMARTDVVLSELLADVAGLYEPRLRENGVRLRLRCADESAMAVGHAGELRQVFSNLLANSIDAVGAAGNIHVRVGPASRQDSSFVCVTVADTGMGIERQHLARLFEPFFTTKKDVGTGLGLWICEQIVLKHGGSIRVRSRVGRGTVFRVKLPAAKPKEKAASAGA